MKPTFFFKTSSTAMIKYNFFFKIIDNDDNTYFSTATRTNNTKYL